MTRQTRTCHERIHRCHATTAERRMSIAATGSTPRPTTTVAASSSEHATMRPDPTSGVQPGLLDRPAARVSITPALRACGSSLDDPAGRRRRAGSRSSRRRRVRAGNGPERRTAAGDTDRRAWPLTRRSASGRDGPGRRTGVGDIGRRIEVRSRVDATVVSSGALSRRATLSRVNATATVAINPPRRTSIGTALLLGSTSVGASALLTTRTWMRSFTGILAASCRALRTSEKDLRGGQRQLGRLRARSEVALIVIIGVADVHRGRHRGRGDRKRAALQVVLRHQAAPLEFGRRRHHWWQEWRRRRSGSRSDPCRRVTC